MRKSKRDLARAKAAISEARRALSHWRYDMTLLPNDESRRAHPMTAAIKPIIKELRELGSEFPDKRGTIEALIEAYRPFWDS